MLNKKIIYACIALIISQETGAQLKKKAAIITALGVAATYVCAPKNNGIIIENMVPDNNPFVPNKDRYNPFE